MINLHKLIPAVIFGPEILRAIGRKIFYIVFFTADHVIRLKGGETSDSIFKSNAEEAKLRRHERKIRLANYLDLRAMKYAELHEFEAAKYLQDFVHLMRKEIDEEQKK